MSDDLRRAVDAMKAEVSGIPKEVQDHAQRMDQRFDTFLVRFDEVVEMLVSADTENLRRIAALEARMDAWEQKKAG